MQEACYVRTGFGVLHDYFSGCARRKRFAIDVPGRKMVWLA
jgi:hypothetical protein